MLFFHTYVTVWVLVSFRAWIVSLKYVVFLTIVTVWVLVSFRA